MARFKVPTNNGKQGSEGPAQAPRPALSQREQCELPGTAVAPRNSGKPAVPLAAASLFRLLFRRCSHAVVR
jgi:hypothetical protein